MMGRVIIDPHVGIKKNLLFDNLMKIWGDEGATIWAESEGIFL